MDDAKKYIIEKLDSMSPESARAAIANGSLTVGPIDSPNYKLALSLIESKEAALRSVFDDKVLRIAKSSRCIAITAIIIASILSTLSIIMAIIALTIKTS